MVVARKVRRCIGGLQNGSPGIVTRRRLHPNKRHGQQEGVLLQEARRAEVRRVLREEENEQVEQNDGNRQQAGDPAKHKEPRLFAMNGAADGPAGEQPGRIDEQDEEDRQRPPQLARRRLDLEQVQRQGEERA